MNTSNRMIPVSLILTFILGFLLLTACGESSNWTDQEYLQQAKESRDRGKFAASVIDLKNALQINPENTEARWLLGEIYLDMGDGAGAEKELRSAVKSGLPGETVQVSIGRALIQQGKYAEVLEELVVSKQTPEMDKSILHAMRGEAYLAERDRAQAEEEFQQAVAITPDSPEGMTGLARVDVMRREYDAARGKLNKVLDSAPGYAPAWELLGDLEIIARNPAEGEQAYSKSIDNSHHNVAVRTKRALLRIERHEFEDAKKDINALEAGGLNKAALLYVKGVLAYHESRFKDAQQFFEETMTLSGDNLQTMYLLGAVNVRLGQFEQGGYYLERVVGMSPGNMDARKTLAELYVRTGRFADAEKALLPVLELHPDDAAALKLASSIYMAQGKTAEGLGYLERAISLRPEATGDKQRLGMGLLSSGEEQRGLDLLYEAIEDATEQSQANYVLIIGLIMAKEFDKALQAAEKMRDEQPDNSVPLNLIGLIQLSKGNEAGARDAFKQALAISPGNPPASFNLMKLYIKQGAFDQAREVGKAVIEHHPEILQTYYELADLENRQEKYTAARDWFEAAIRTNTKVLKPRLHLAKYYLSTGQPERSIALLQEVEAEYPEHPLRLIALGEAQLALGQLINAETTFRQVAKLYPGLMEGHYFLAMTYSKLNKQAKMRRELEAALEIDPEHMDSRVAMAGLLIIEGKSELAQKMLEDLKQSEPGDTRITSLEGLLAMQQKQPEEAVRLFETVMDKRPDSQTALDLANAQLAAGNFDASEATLKAWLAEHPEDVMVQLRLANTYLVLKRSKEAKLILSRLAEQLPDNPLVLNSLAWHLRTDDPARAQELAERSLELAPNLAPAMDTLGVILLQQGDDLPRAVRLLKEAALQATNVPAIRYHYAQALARDGEREQSRAILEELLSQDKAFAEKEEARQLLQELSD